MVSVLKKPTQNPRKTKKKPSLKNPRLKVRDPPARGKKLGPGSCYFQTKAVERDSSRETSCLNLSEVVWWVFLLKN